MNEIAVKRHSFDVAKNRLKEFSEKTEAELEIDKVRTDGGFLGLGDHKVTGYELNRRLETIQEHFIAVNTTNNKVIKAFREVYNVLDVLDKDYITSIIANVKAIEKTSKAKDVPGCSRNPDQYYNIQRWNSHRMSDQPDYGILCVFRYVFGNRGCGKAMWLQIHFVCG